jgi:glycosyltransferase 2 family protein
VADTSKVGNVSTGARKGSPRRLADRLRGIFVHPAVRVAVTVLALAIFVHSVNLFAALAKFGHLQGTWALLAMLLTAVTVLTSILEWGLLLRGACGRVSWHYLGNWYVKGLFINQVVPAGIGSDATRAMQVGRRVGHGPVIASLVGSRMAGMLGMGFWGLAGAVVLNTGFHTNDVVGFAVFTGLMLLAWGLALIAEPLFGRIRGQTLGMAKSWRTHHLTERFAIFLRSLGRYRGAPRALLLTILVGSIGWGLNLLALQAFSQALGHNVSWGVFALALPIALLVTFIPISVNGLGLREGVLVFLLALFHVPLATATAIALFVDLQLVPFAAFGGLVHVAEVIVKRASLTLSRAGTLHGSLWVLYPVLRWLVAPEAVLDITGG